MSVTVKTRIIMLMIFAIGFGFQGEMPKAENPGTGIEHVILIVIDGVRPDVLQEVDTPHIDRLALEGSYTWKAWTVCPSISIKAIPSIFTGARPYVHRVECWDGDIHAETLTEVFIEAGSPTAIINQDPILAGYNPNAYVTGFSWRSPEEITNLALDWLQTVSVQTPSAQARPAFMTLYDPYPDRAAHQYGDQSRQYHQAIQEADSQVGRIIAKLEEFGIYDRTLIIVTTDHGFTGMEHENCNPTDMQVFSVWRGPGVKANFEIPDQLYIREYDICVAHEIIDIAPTIAALVGLRAPARSQGRVIEEIIVGVSVEEIVCP